MDAYFDGVEGEEDFAVLLKEFNRETVIKSQNFLKV